MLLNLQQCWVRTLKVHAELLKNTTLDAELFKIQSGAEDDCFDLERVSVTTSTAWRSWRAKAKIRTCAHGRKARTETVKAIEDYRRIGDVSCWIR